MPLKTAELQENLKRAFKNAKDTAAKRSVNCSPKRYRKNYGD